MELALNCAAVAVFVLEQFRRYRHPHHKTFIFWEPQVPIGLSANVNLVSIIFIQNNTCCLGSDQLQPAVFIQQRHRLSSVKHTGPALAELSLAQ